MEAGRLYDDRTVAILLVAASVVLLANGIFNVEQSGVQYGLGAGAILQGNAYNVSVIPALQATALQIKAIYQTILEGFLISGIGMLVFAMSLALLFKGQNSYERYVGIYVPLHIMLVLIYLVLLLIMHITYAVDLYATYVAMAVCIIFDAHIGYKTGRLASRRRPGRSISIDPSTPYANLVTLKEQLFDNLAGTVCIVDKHFNSNAISNLYRLIPSEGQKIASIRILTSSGMLDSGFGRNYTDLREELRNNGIEVEVRVMKEDDAATQHERFIFDDTAAYKIPPLNIINRKSEHVVRTTIRDARKRFEYLYQNAMKLENYMEKQGRGSSQA